MTTKKKQKVCFVICPIGSKGTPERIHSDRVLTEIIKPIMAENVYTVVRADRLPDPGNITKQVIEHLMGADLIIADLTGRNPNVFYELAICHALRKPTIHLIKEGERIPFDLAPYRAIMFNLDAENGVDECKLALAETLKSMKRKLKGIDNPFTAVLDLQEPLWKLITEFKEEEEKKSVREVLVALRDAFVWGRVFKRKRMFNSVRDQVVGDVKLLGERTLIFRPPTLWNHWNELVGSLNDSDEICLVSNNDLRYWEKAIAGVENEARNYSLVLDKLKARKTRILIVDKSIFSHEDQVKSAKEIALYMRKNGFRVLWVLGNRIDQPKRTDTQIDLDFGIIGTGAVTFFHRDNDADISRSLIVSFDGKVMAKAREDWLTLSKLGQSDLDTLHY
jgi:hypothetical protein